MVHHFDSSLGKVAYMQAGDNTSPHILFLHNGGTDHTIWSPMISLLQQKYFITAVDLPGYGKSLATTSDNTIRDFAIVVQEAIEILHLKNVTLVGNCAGSAAAISHCINQKNQNVDHLILFNALAAETMSMESILALKLDSNLKRFGIYLSKALANITSKTTLSGKAFINFQLHAKNRMPIHIKKHLSSLYQHPNNLVNLAKLGSSVQKHNQFFNIKGSHSFPPTLLLWGSNNRVLPIRKGKKFMAQFNANDTKVIKGGHLVMLEEPEKCADLIDQFMIKTH